MARFTILEDIRCGRIRVSKKYDILFINPGIIIVFFPSLLIAIVATLEGSITEGVNKPRAGLLPRYPGVAVAPAQHAVIAMPYGFNSKDRASANCRLNAFVPEYAATNRVPHIPASDDINNMPAEFPFDFISSANE